MPSGDWDEGAEGGKRGLKRTPVLQSVWEGHRTAVTERGIGCPAETGELLSVIFMPDAAGRLPFNLGGWKCLFKIKRLHGEDLFVVYQLFAFPLGNRCTVAPGCAPGNVSQAGSRGSAGSASGRLLAAGAGIESGTAVILSASLQRNTQVRGSICLARRK